MNSHRSLCAQCLSVCHSNPAQGERMHCVVGRCTVLITHSPLRREDIVSATSLKCMPKSRCTVDTLRAGSAWWRGGGGTPSPAPYAHVGRITLAKNRNYNKKNAHLKSVVLAAKLEGSGDVLVENEPLVKLSQGQRQFFHWLPSGLRMEIISQTGENAEEGGHGGTSRAPLLFVHGSYHAAWCWACTWLPYFAARGHDCYAISLLGQGASDVPVEKVSFSLQSHAGDLAHFIKHNLTARPVLIGHSFGGLIVQWFFSHTISAASAQSSTLTEGWEQQFPNVAAVALVCSIPPTGNGPMVKRFLQRDIIASIQITLSLAAKLFGSSLSLCRKSFFSLNMPEAEVQKYQKLLKRSSRYPLLDLRKLNNFLPLPRHLPQAPPVFVLAAENDFIVDHEGSRETAEWYGTEPLVITDSGHDIMLDTAWEKGAEALHLWLDQQTL